MTDGVQTFYLKIPDEIKFTDLDVKSDPESFDITINMRVVDRILEANNISIDEAEDENDFLGSLLLSWYQQWLKVGGEPNTTMEQVCAEIEVTGAPRSDAVINAKVFL